MAGTAILPEDQKIFSMKELKEKGFSQYKVSKLVDEGKLIKLNKSYYENAEYRGEESDFYYTEAYAPKGVICLLSAAVYYHLTTFIPDAVDVAIPRKAKVSTVPDWPQMNVHHYTDDRHELGVIRSGKVRMNSRSMIWKRPSWISCFTEKRSALKKPRRSL
ncbi:MAG: type IV toxin-antitoxin system AbiEi family antitoxin domain-containing protein [Waltera sp.]